MIKNSNKLLNEKSPYLLQHAHNPVDWFPWSDDAFEKARIEDKPIFLSIGYSTCHWCHVMEKESFEDKDVAKLMNDAFVSIKVDREERPDIDGIYMSVCQMMTGSGGWPLTIVMTPDKKPFFAGTYFPKNNRYGRIGMLELAPKLKDVWINKRDDILKSADEIASSLNTGDKETAKVQIDELIFTKAYAELLRRYDDTDGGFGNAPKFPTPHNLIFLLRYWKRKNEPKALEMVEKTLREMRKGGIYDHIGFGFARYSTDQNWLVPHFEKMLYDQAMLVLAYTETFLATKNIFYKNTAQEILEYVKRDMTHPEGGFYSAEDADSEGEEGKFYLWDADEIRNILERDDSDFAISVFNVADDGNWIDESKGMMTGTNILHFNKSYKEYAKEFNLSEEDFSRKLESVRKKLFNNREKRIHPYKDDKILVDWNGLMISAFAKAAQAFDDDRYSEAAIKAYSFIEKYLIDKEGRLIHRFRENESGLPAHIDDYAFIINASIDLYETTFEIKYLNRAVDLNKILLNEFWDNESGGFYFTSIKSENLIARLKEVYDGAIPSGNSVSLLNLIRLSRFTGNTSLDDISHKMIEYFSGYVSKSPSVFTQFLSGLDFYFGPTYEIVISSDGEDQTTKEAIDLIRGSFNPGKVVVLNFPNQVKEISKVIPFVTDMKIINNKPTFYVCKNFICNAPVHTTNELKILIDK
jgi:uncharacterized protein YyaL (SSP411 family)